MGLFDKKYCDICGGKIGLLGNRKLEDGNLCKDCAAKLSPWFSERRRSTVEDIRAQLAYREENLAKVAAFNPTRTIGGYYMVYLDEDAGKFCVAQSGNFRNANPDILDFTQVTGCDLDVSESRSEVRYQDAEGHHVSYDPPRYDYSYDFYVRLRVNHPWFDEMRFRINPSTVRIAHGSAMPAGGPGMPPPPPGQRPMPGQQPAPGQRPMPGQRPPQPPMNPGMQPGFVSQTFDPTSDPEYQQYEAMGMEIRQAVMDVRQAARDEIAAANAPRTAVVCPHCGATTIFDLSGCCEFCGAAVG